MKTKVCRECKKELPVEKFSSFVKSGGKKVVRNMCFECTKIYNREWRRRQVPVARICSDCGEFKGAKHFGKGRAVCKTCYARQTRERNGLSGYISWAKRNPERSREIKRKHKRKKYSAIVTLMKERGGACVECGESDLRTLVFHHRNPKDKVEAVGRSDTLGRMREEAKKCDLLCANCHAKKHIVIIDGTRRAKK